MMTTQPNFARYLQWLVITVAAGIGVVVGFVILIDPYGLYGTVDRPGLNTIKPGLTRYHDEIKLTHAVAKRPSGLILGNSRAEIGFDPDTPSLAKAGTGFYNLSIPGTTIQTSAAQLEYLREKGIKPNTIIIGLEFLDFVVEQSRKQPTDLTHLGISADHPASKIFWRIDTLFSLKSFRDAVQTLQIQRDANAVTMTPRGFNPLKEYKIYAKNDGYHVLFQQKAQVYAKSFFKKMPSSLAPENLRVLNSILAAAALNGTEVQLVVYPYHAQFLALFELTGLWPVFEEWKKQVVLEIASVKDSHPGANIKLTDFSGFGEYACERIPSIEDRGASTRWYWESGHFKRELGDIMLSKLMMPNPSTLVGEVVLDNALKFGVRLDETSIASNVQRISAERAKCVNDYPTLFSDVHKLMSSIRSGH